MISRTIASLASSPAPIDPAKKRAPHSIAPQPAAAVSPQPTYQPAGQSASHQSAPDVWVPYYKVTQRQGPRKLLLETLGHVGEAAMRPGFSVDLGTGTGAAARLIYERTRWEVWALDASASADQYLCQRFGNQCPLGLTFIHDSFHTMRFAPSSVDLAWAGLALPYVPQGEIALVWDKIVDCLRDGGIFAGDFFGPEHRHFGRQDMNFHEPHQLEALLAGMDIIKLERNTRPHPFSQGKPMMMDCYHVIARKP
ncbi:MAG: hypothetical protein RIR70_1501 [Pseudomonadota bacterium]